MEETAEQDYDEPLSEEAQIANAHAAVVELAGCSGWPGVGRFDLSTWGLVLDLVGRAHTRGYVAGKTDGFIEGKNAPVVAAERDAANAKAESTEYEVVCQKCGVTAGAVGTREAGLAAAAHFAASPACVGSPVGINRRHGSQAGACEGVPCRCP